MVQFHLAPVGHVIRECGPDQWRYHDILDPKQTLLETL